MKVGLWAGAAVIALMAEQIYAMQWRGSAEVNYQNFPGAVRRDELWREFVDLSFEDRLFAKNVLRITPRWETRSFGPRQPHETRWRIGLELTGQGYAFQGFYAPFNRPRYGLPDNSEHRYNAALSVFPQDYPRVSFSYDALSSKRDSTQDEQRRSYTLTADYARAFWRGQLRLLKQNRDSEPAGRFETLKSAFIGQNLEWNREWATSALTYQFEYSDRRPNSGINQYAAVHNVTARLGATPIPRLQLAADYSGRLSNTSEGGVHRATDDHTASARVTTRPFDFVEAALLRYYSIAELAVASETRLDFYQARVGFNGRMFSSLSGALSVYRTWYVTSTNESDINDALYIQTGGDIFPHTRLSFEISYADQHAGALPITLVRAVSLRMKPAYRSEWQIDYASQAASSKTDLGAVDRQNINITMQQGLGNRAYFSVGTGFNQDRLISMEWNQRWLVSGGLGIRRWMLISGNYNRLTSISIIPGQPPAVNTPTRTDLQITLYPEARWVISANVFETRSSTGVANTTWGGSVRYRL